MLISISTSKSGYPLYYKPVDIKTPKELAAYVCSVVWSPIVWREGKRKTENFLHSDLFGLDFDEGISLAEIKKKLLSQNLRSLIGLTKSHQKEKSGKPPCDRFRVIIPWSARITDYRQYRQNLEKISQVFPGDKACKDGARIFQPCAVIDSVIPGVPYIPRPYKEPVNKYAHINEYYKTHGIIPRWIRDMMDNPPGSGQRNLHCFKIAAGLSKYGFSEADCLGAVMACRVDIPEREKMSAAKSGFKAGKNPRSP